MEIADVNKPPALSRRSNIKAVASLFNNVEIEFCISKGVFLLNLFNLIYPVSFESIPEYVTVLTIISDLIKLKSIGSSSPNLLIVNLTVEPFSPLILAAASLKEYSFTSISSLIIPALFAGPPSIGATTDIVLFL